MTVAVALAATIYLVETRHDQAILDQTQSFEAERTLYADRRENQRFVLLAAAQPEGAEWRNFRGLDLTDSSLVDLDLAEASFNGATLVRTEMIRTDLTQATLVGADLRESNLSGANLLGADLTNSDLSFAHAAGTSFTGARISSSSLANAYFLSADLTGATLYRSDLTDAHLGTANLTETVLVGTNLTGTNFLGATLTRAAIYDVYWEEGRPPLWPDGFVAPENVGTEASLRADFEPLRGSAGPTLLALT